MERTMLLLMKATEARLAAVVNPKVVVCDSQGAPLIPITEVEQIRADLYLAILELKDKVK